MGDTAEGSWTSRELLGFIRREEARKEKAMSTRHTLGPWTVNLSTYRPAGQNERKPDAWEVLGPHGEPLPTDYNDPESEGNARFIAAAPETAAERDRLREVNKELLEACKFSFSVSLSHPDMGNNTEFNELRETLQAAIAKAEGRP